jgi:hypothetical protein
LAGQAAAQDARPLSLPNLITPWGEPSTLGAAGNAGPAISLLDGVDPADDRSNREGRLRIGADGRLLDTSETFFIQSGSDAEACDFLVEEDVLDSGRASSLVHAFHEAEGQLLCATNSRPTNANFLWMRELAAISPPALATMVQVVGDGMARTARFYGLDAPLFPDLVKLTRLGKGMSVIPPKRWVSARVSGEENHRQGFTGQLFISDCHGGALYFTGLDMAVEPKLGRFVAAPTGSSHEHALLRVEEGILLVLSFAMRTSREHIGPYLRSIF